MTRVSVDEARRHEMRVGDAAVMAIAASQHGVVTTAQLASAGLSRDAIVHRVRVGRLRRLHRGVYLVGPLTGPLTKEMAALFACGERAALSHATAGARGGLLPDSPVVHVSAAGNLRRHGGVRVHRVARLHSADITVRDGCRLTTPARTLADLASHLATRELQRAVEEAQVQRLVTRHELLTLLPSRSSPALRRAIEDHQEPALTRSEAERRLLDLIRSAQLPPHGPTPESDGMRSTSSGPTSASSSRSTASPSTRPAPLSSATACATRTSRRRAGASCASPGARSPATRRR